MPPKTLRGGAIKPWQSPSFRECQDDLVKYAKKRGIALDVPWRDMDDAQRRWVLEGEPEWVNWDRSWPGTWYGVKHFFAWLETKAYKMHIRVLLSKYRAYTPCAACGSARLKPDALLWRLGTERLSIHDLALLPIDRVREFFANLTLPAPLDEASDLLLEEIRARLRYLADVGSGLSHARSPVAHALRRRGPAHQPHHGARHVARQHAVRARRAFDRPASTRHGPHHRGDAALARRRQFAGRRRARSAGDARRRPGDRHRTRSRRARRRDRLLRDAGGADRDRALAHRRLSRRTQARRSLDGAVRPRPMVRASSFSVPASTISRASTSRFRSTAWCASPACRDRASRRWCRTCCTPRCCEPRASPPKLRAHIVALRGSDLIDDGRAGRPGADRPHDALESGELRRRLRRDPQALRRCAAREGARLHAGHVQLQRGHRTLPAVRRQRLRARRDAVPFRRLSALPGLRRQAISRGSARREASRPLDRRRARHDGR